MALHIKDWLAAQIDMPPLASSDPDLFLDLDFRTGQAAINAKLVTAEGFTHTNPSGGIWDSTLGWNPNGSEYYRNTDWGPSAMAGGTNALKRAAVGDNFTIHAEIQRTALSVTYKDDNSNFLDSDQGASLLNPYTPPANAHPLGVYHNAAPFPFLQIYLNAASATQSRLLYESKNDTNAASNWQMRFHPDYLSSEDAFASVDIVVEGLKEYIYIDGLLRIIKSRTVMPTSGDDVLQAVYFALVPGGTTFKGYIRRIQFIKRACKAKNYSSPTVAFIGDSFVQRGCNHATPAAQTVAAINAVQNGKDDSLLSDNANSNNNPVMAVFYAGWINGLQKLAAKNGARFRFYCAGDSGHAWSSTVGAGTAQIRQGFFDAVGAYDPEILVCLGSVNDVNTASPPTDLVGETKNRLTYVAGKCRNLRKILFFQTFPPYKGNNGNAAYIAEYKRQIGIQSQLDGYAVTTKDGRTVTVQFVPTYAALGGDNYSANFNAGGHADAPLWDALYTKTETGNDVHPGQYGMNRMVEIIWPALSPYLLNAAMYYS